VEVHPHPVVSSRPLGDDAGLQQRLDEAVPPHIADYNRRFAKPPAVAHDAHRPLRPDDDLSELFTLQAPRRISRQLTVHYKRDMYVLEDTVATRRLRGATAMVSEAEDGTVTIRVNGRALPARL